MVANGDVCARHRDADTMRVVRVTHGSKRRIMEWLLISRATSTNARN
jgi:hypothetical protein